ncbi:MAG: hypothetical protein KAS62_11910 [Candidatus Delongbacteria bacterium]|nr:hypothetical protein [Candidatus Delongbacteria bacterium]
MKVLNSDCKTGNSKILIGEKLSNCFKYITADDIVVVTDVNVNRIYSYNFNRAINNKKDRNF